MKNLIIFKQYKDMNTLYQETKSIVDLCVLDVTVSESRGVKVLQTNPVYHFY